MFSFFWSRYGRYGLFFLSSAPALMQQFAAKGSSFQRRVLSVTLFSTFLFSVIRLQSYLETVCGAASCILVFLPFTYLRYPYLLALRFCCAASCRPFCLARLSCYPQSLSLPLLIPLWAMFYLHLFSNTLSTIFTCDFAIPMNVILVSFSLWVSDCCLSPEMFLLRAVLANLMFSYWDAVFVSFDDAKVLCTTFSCNILTLFSCRMGPFFDVYQVVVCEHIHFVAAHSDV